MAIVVCKKCGLRGHSKCPFCRNVRASHGGQLGMVDTIMSYTLKFDSDKIEIRLRADMDDNGAFTGKHESPADVLELIVSLINDVVEKDKLSLKQVCAVVGCVHEWVFAPHQYSDIGCRHRANPDPDFQSHAGAVADFASAGFDPEEMCTCGDKLKAHHDNLECACCECGIFTPVGSPAANQETRA